MGQSVGLKSQQNWKENVSVAIITPEGANDTRMGCNLCTSDS